MSCTRAMLTKSHAVWPESIAEVDIVAGKQIDERGVQVSIFSEPSLKRFVQRDRRR